MKKKIQFLKSRVLELVFASASIALVLMFTLPSCNNAKHEDSKEVAEDHNDAKFDNAKEDDAKFLVSAAEINLEEIQLGQLAQSNSMNADVKNLGKMMETEHTKALSDLQALAAKKQITIPTTLTDDGMSASKKLMDMKESKFDKEYCDMMVNGHKDAISKFEKASTDAKDEDIRNWASSMLPALRTHLDHSITCQKECEKM
ncbi:MAG: DUF4142 domain-containing protein [Bacteroidia bacterium]